MNKFEGNKARVVAKGHVIISSTGCFHACLDMYKMAGMGEEMQGRNGKTNWGTTVTAPVINNICQWKSANITRVGLVLSSLSEGTLNDQMLQGSWLLVWSSPSILYRCIPYSQLLREKKKCCPTDLHWHIWILSLYLNHWYCVWLCLRICILLVSLGIVWVMTGWDCYCIGHLIT